MEKFEVPSTDSNIVMFRAFRGKRSVEEVLGWVLDESKLTCVDPSDMPHDLLRHACPSFVVVFRVDHPDHCPGVSHYSAEPSRRQVRGPASPSA